MVFSSAVIGGRALAGNSRPEAGADERQLWEAPKMLFVCSSERSERRYSSTVIVMPSLASNAVADVHA